jgi:hypothetical protein
VARKKADSGTWTVTWKLPRDTRTRSEWDERTAAWLQHFDGDLHVLVRDAIEEDRSRPRSRALSCCWE